MSLSFTFTGTGSTLSADFFPSIELDETSSYEVGLLGFESYNSIPNIDSLNNKFHYGDDSQQVIEIPEGTYELSAIAAYIQHELFARDRKLFMHLQANNNTLKTHIKTNFPVDFTPKDSVGRLLGFKPAKIPANRLTISDNVVDIFKVNSVHVDCNIATGSFINGRLAHTIFQFFPSVSAGFKIIEEPTPVIYLPVTTRSISNITLRIVDQSGNLVNFRGEKVTIRLHLRKSLTS